MLAIALLIIAALSATAVALANYLSTETRLMRYHLAQAQARALAKGGLILAIEQLAVDTREGEECDWEGDNWAYVPVGKPKPEPWVIALASEETITIEVADEESRLNLNSSQAQTLPGQLDRLVNKPNAGIGQAIVDYRDPPDPTNEDQPTLKPPYVAKNADFKSLGELGEIGLSITPQYLKAYANELLILNRQATVYSSGSVNVNTASPNMLKVVKGAATPPWLETFVKKRDAGAGNDGQPGTQDDCLLTKTKDYQRIANRVPAPFNEVESLMKDLGYESKVFRITSTGKTTPSIKYHVEAIVQREASGQKAFPIGKTAQPVAFEIVAWQEK